MTHSSIVQGLFRSFISYNIRSKPRMLRAKLITLQSNFRPAPADTGAGSETVGEEVVDRVE